MYQFKIKKQDNGEYRFELGGIKLLVDDYVVKDDKHLLTHPDKTIAYFNIGDNIYGVSNHPLNFPTAEAFYDAINQQYMIFTNNTAPPDYSNQRNYTNRK